LSIILSYTKTLRLNKVRQNLFNCISKISETALF
jgi:hypothetical protein